MASLSEEEKEILQHAYRIRKRLRAEEIEAGEEQDDLTNEEIRILRQAYRIRKRLRAEEIEAGEEQESAASSSDGQEEWEADEEAGGEAEEDLSFFSQSGGKPPKQDRGRAKEARQAPPVKQKAADEERAARPKAEKRKRKKHRLLRLLFVLLLLGIALGAALLLFLRYKISAMNYVPYETSYVRSEDVMHEDGVTNILLIGTDARSYEEDPYDSRSDAMIVLSINEKKHRIVMTSILRDSYVQIEGYGQNRINHAYQMGGPALLIQTIEQNFKLGIDFYVMVDFFSFIDIIDVFGGVTIDVTEEELPYILGYTYEINTILGDAPDDQFLETAGTQVLTGKQALAYSRIRYIGTDFARTDRQRTVLNALLGRAKHANPITLYLAVDSILPDLTTNIEDETLTKLLLKAIFYLRYSITEHRVPADGTWWNDYMGEQEVLGMDFNANIEQLRSVIYQ